MARPLNFGVLGLGMGMHHCTAVLNAKGANLVAVCDHDPKRLEAGVKEFKVPGYATWPELVKDKNVDAICIATESGTHTRFGVEAARAGKHILMEKPVDVSLARIRKLQDEVKRAGVSCGCVYQYRMDKLNIMLRKAIQAGKMGKVIGAHIHLPWMRLNSYFEGPHGTWRGTWKLDGGGSLSNQGIHCVDLLQWLAGPVHSVCGFYGVFNHPIEAEDQAVAILKFENGALGTLYTTTCANPDQPFHLYMYGTKGSFSRRGEHLEYYEMGSPKERERMRGMTAKMTKCDSAGLNPLALSTQGHTLLIEDLVQAIRSGREPAITIESAKHSVEIVTAVYQSARTGRAIEIAKLRE